MKFTVAELATALGAETFGDDQLEVARPSAPESAGADDLLLAMEPRYADNLSEVRARAAVLWPGADWRALGFEGGFFAPRSRYAMAGLTAAFDVPLVATEGIHPTAIIDPSANIGEGASIGPFCVIGPDVVIGPRARIFAHTVFAERVRVGADALIQAGVRLMRDIVIGDRVIIHANAVIGADGFSFVTPQPGAIEEAKATGIVSGLSPTNVFARIQSIGAVSIGNDVEIGAGTCIDRGTVANTVVGDGTKIDNLVQVGHNVQIGMTCLLCGQVGIAGSVTVGDRVVLGGRVGVADQVRIGSDTLVAGGSLVGGHIAKQSVVMGIPAVKRDLAIQGLRLNRRLPQLFETVADLKKLVSKLGSNG